MRDWTGKTIVGRYEILEKIGDGGFASVWKARETRPGAEVAIKILDDEHAGDEAYVKSFFEQANKFAKYRDRAGLSTVLDFGTDKEAGVVYLAMSLLGDSLEKRLGTETKLDTGECCRLAREVAAALAVLHADGIVHQNLNARNILARPGDGRFVLTDFGVGLVGETLERTARTMDLNRSDIWAYTSPEQIQSAKPEEIGPAADYYALGVTLFRSATGRFPFVPRIPKVLMDHVSEPPPDPASIEPGIDPNLRALILQCLEKDPSARPSSPAEIDTALAAPIADPQEGGSSANPAPRLVMMAAGAALLLTAVIFGSRMLGGEEGDSYAISSTPAGATYRVYEDEKMRFSEAIRKGATPSSFQLTPGTYSLDLDLEGYFSRSGEPFEVGPGDSLPHYKLDRKNRVTVKTMPPDALVVLRAVVSRETNSDQGKAPSFYPVRPGEYEVEATHEDYDLYRDTIIIGDQDRTITVTLPEKTGKAVWIFTLPDGANVSIDGTPVSIPTNCLIGDVPFGFRTFTFSRLGYATFDTSIAIVPDDGVDTVAVELGEAADPVRSARSANLSAVHRLIREYSIAIEKENVPTLRSLIHEFPTEEERFWTRYFGAADNIDATVLILRQDVRERTAELDVRLFLDYRDKRGAEMESSLEYTVELEKLREAWRINRTKPRG